MAENYSLIYFLGHSDTLPSVLTQFQQVVACVIFALRIAVNKFTITQRSLNRRVAFEICRSAKREAAVLISH